MKLHSVCAFVITMLVISEVASGEILEAGDYYVEGSATGNRYLAAGTAWADGTDTQDYGYADGWQFVYTTQYEGDLDWYYHVYVWAEGTLNMRGYDWAGLRAYAYAKGYCKYWTPPDSNTAEVYQPMVQGQGYFQELPWWDGVYEETRTGQGYYSFNANEGVRCEHAIFVVVSVQEGSEITGQAHADARAYGDLWHY